MTLSSRLGGALLPAGLASLLAVGAAAQDTIDLPGATSVTLGWEPAAGPVAGYYVITSRTGGVATVSQITGETRATIQGESGEEVVVQVAAFDSVGQTGPLSPPSPTLRFLPAADTTSSSTSTSTGDTGTTTDPAPAPAPALQRAVAMDYTGDGISDLLVAPDGDLQLLVMDGAHVADRRDLPELGTGWSVAGHGDYDGNGYADVLWREDATGALLVWLLRDAAVVDSATLDLSQLSASEEWKVEGSADFDADGRDDVLLRHVRSGDLTLLYMAGRSIAASASFAGRSRGFSIAALGDVDADDAAEIVWLDEKNLRLVLWDLQGGSVDSRVMTATWSWKVIGTGDFDGDGRADLFVQRRDPDEAAVWRLAGPSVAGVDALPTPTRAQSLVGTGDYDGNGRSDLFWRDTGTGAGEIWFSDAGQVAPELVVDAQAQGALLPSGTSGTCTGDFDGDGIITSSDVWAVIACIQDPSGPGCALADVDGDGAITDADFYRQRERVGWPACSTDGP